MRAWHCICSLLRVVRAAHLLPGLLANLLAVPAAWAQGNLRLADHIEAPLLYLSLEAVPVVAGAVAEPGPVHALLADPALAAWLGSAQDEASSLGRALVLVRGVLTRSAGDVEIAITSVIPADGQPLLVLRARLQPGASTRLSELLAGPELATPQRRLGGVQTWKLRGGEAAPGREVELAVVGDDLVIANDIAALGDLLEPRQRTTTASPKVLAAEPRFVAMKAQLTPGPGSLLVYGDWQRLGRRFAEWTDGLPEALLGASGLDDARAVMASVVGAEQGFGITMLVDLDRAPADAGGGAERGGPTAGGPPSCDIDGWLDAVRSVPARSLVTAIPDGGVGSVVLALDVETLATRSHKGARLLDDIAHAFDERGLDFQKKVLDRLGSVGAVQMVFGGEAANRGPDAANRGPDAANRGGAAALVLRTKSRRAALDLFDDLRRTVVGEDMGQFHAATERGGLDLLEVRPDRPRRGGRPPEGRGGRPPEGRGGRRGEARDGEPFEPFTVHLAVLDDVLLLASAPETLLAVHQERSRAQRLRTRRQDSLLRTLNGFGNAPIAGIVDLDLRPLFADLAARLGGPDRAPVDFSRFPQRHSGTIEVAPRGDGTTLRIRLTAPR